MNLRASMVLAVIALVMLATPLHGAQSQYHHEQQQADKLYADGDYETAYKKYRGLAKKGDSFSQYRVSYMYLEGQGVRQDTIEAFAWAALSAQNGQEEFVHYRDSVAGLVPENKRRKAERKVDYYFRKWGNMALAEDAYRRSRREIRTCTGSRLGTRCEEVYAMQMPKFWGISPGGEGGVESGGGAAPSGSVADGPGNGAGGPTRNVAYYQHLRASIKALDQYISEHGGTVELGEFEVLEPEDDGSSQSPGDGDSARDTHRP